MKFIYVFRIVKDIMKDKVLVIRKSMLRTAHQFQQVDLVRKANSAIFNLRFVIKPFMLDLFQINLITVGIAYLLRKGLHVVIVLCFVYVCVYTVKFVHCC